jgi:hypothetical protein
MTGFNPSLLGTVAACYGSLIIHVSGTVIKDGRVYGLRSSIRLKINSCTRAVNLQVEKNQNNENVIYMIETAKHFSKHSV